MQCEGTQHAQSIQNAHIQLPTWPGCNGHGHIAGWLISAFQPEVFEFQMVARKIKVTNKRVITEQDMNEW